MRSFLCKALIGVLVIITLPSCADDGGSRSGVAIERTTRLALKTFDDAGLHGFWQQLPAPAEIAFLIDYQVGPKDTGRAEVISKIEINYGDGSGWFDVTADRASWDYLTESDPAGMTHHVYQNPGLYYVNARITFWDGEVVYDAALEVGFPLGLPVTVLEPVAGP